MVQRFCENTRVSCLCRSRTPSPSAWSSSRWRPVADGSGSTTTQWTFGHKTRSQAKLANRVENSTNKTMWNICKFGNVTIDPACFTDKEVASSPCERKNNRRLTKLQNRKPFSKQLRFLWQLAKKCPNIITVRKASRWPTQIYTNYATSLWFCTISGWVLHTVTVAAVSCPTSSSSSKPGSASGFASIATLTSRETFAKPSPNRYNMLTCVSFLFLF